LYSTVVDRAGGTEANFGGDVVGNHRRLVMTGAAGLADRQVNGVADHVDILQAVNLQRFMMGRQPALVIRCL
jgi:hypothetical protein